jgi:hypothetical protein
MRKDFIIATVALFLIASPAYASQSQKDNENRKDENHGQVISSEHIENEKEKNEAPVTQEEVVLSVDVSPAPTLVISSTLTSTPRVDDQDDKGNKDVKGAKTAEGCDSEGSWKNHGEYVSCVAKQHVDGKEVSDAAKSDIGKKSDEDHDDENDDDDTVPSVTPSVSVSPTITPPLTSPATEVRFSFTSWEDFKKLLAQFFRGFHFN